MTLPDWREWLYSAKAFTAAALALYIALLLSFTNPYWAVATVYVVSHPLSGATHSKALYRVCGTLIGAAASVALVPAFVETPALMCLATALWVGVLLYLALLNPTPSGYIFMLAAYTMPLISLPTLARPEQIFDFALARSEEITLGIVCAAFINAVVFPRRMEPVVGTRILQLLDDAAVWATSLLDPTRGGGATADMRHRLIADIAALDATIRQMSYDAYSREQIEYARQMRLRMLMLVPHVAALRDPLDALRLRRASIVGSVAELAAEVGAWMESRRDDADAVEGLRMRVRALSDGCAGNDLDQALARNVLLQLNGLLDLWQDCLSLHGAYVSGKRVAALRYHPQGISDRQRHYDHGLMLFSSVSAAGATFVAGMLWVASGWPYGSSGVMLMAVGCCFFAAVDDPAPMLNKFLFWMFVSTVLSLLYLFAVLPLVHSYIGLIAVLAPCLLFAGAFTGFPQHNMAVLLFTTQAVSDLGLRSAYAANFESFANGSLSAIFGIVFALIWMAVTKPFGTEQIARRLAHAGWRDLVKQARGRSRVDGAGVVSRMVDRVAQLLPRVALLKDRPLAQLDVIRDLRVCLRLFELERQRPCFPESAVGRIDRVFDDVAAHYDACLAAGSAVAFAPALHRRLDDAVRGVLLAQSDPQAAQVSQALVGLYLALTAGRVDVPEPEEAGFSPLLPSPG
jgi:uncharacterized membrane protein YccC